MDHPPGKHSDADLVFMEAAIEEAERGAAEGGVPIGAALAEDGAVVATGRNRRVQQGDPIAHGEMDCLRAAGRRRSYRNTALYRSRGVEVVVVGDGRCEALMRRFMAERPEV